MENKRPLAPGFINKLDKYLLLNKPDTWTARTHLVWYYSLLFTIVLSAICFLVHDDPRQSSPSFVWGFFTGVLALLGFIVWLIYLLRFNVFKRFGVVEKGDNLKTFILYFLSVGIMGATIFVPPAIETIRANHAYADEEIINDVNEMNLSIGKLNKNSLPVKWDADSCLVKDTVVAAISDSVAAFNDKGRRVYNGHSENYYIIDTAEADRRKFEADSTFKINDSLYVFYKCPDYEFIKSYGSYYTRPYEHSSHSFDGLLNSVDIYKQVFKNPAQFDKDKLQERLQFLLKKYKVKEDQSAYEESYNEEASYTYRINKKYGLSYVNNSITNITDRKYRWQGYALPIFIRFFFYTTLVLSLLIFIFRHSTVRTFFLSLLAGIILLILTSLFLSLANTRATGVFICFLIYFGIFFTLSSTIYFNKARKLVNGIGLNFTVFFIPFIPLLITALYYQLLRDADESRRYTLKTYDGPDLTKYANESMHYLFAEIIGFVLLLVLIETVFKKLYRTWYALPEA